jgi:hypothetical protein
MIGETAINQGCFVHPTIDRGAVEYDGGERERMASVTKFDLFKEHKADYVSPKRPVLLEMPPAQYLSITGHGEAGGREFQTQVGAIYAVAFAVKMAAKAAGRDYVMSKMEGLWWGENPEEVLLGQQRSVWNWKLLIRTPDFVTEAEVTETIRKLAEKGKTAEVGQVRLEMLNEGRCVQMLHVGPYTAEAPALQAMRDFAVTQRLTLHGLHHEIYLSDPRRTAPAKLRTILRHPAR